MSYEQPNTLHCGYHPHQLAVGYCNQCGQPVCAECNLPHGDRRLCPVCVVSAGKPAPNTLAIIFGSLSAALAISLIVVLVAGARVRAVPPPPAPPTPGMIAPGMPGELTGPAMGLTPPGIEMPPFEPLTPPAMTMPPTMPPPYPTPPALATPPVPPRIPRGEKTALSAALEGRAGWSGKITSHTPDWKKATVVLGPSSSDPRLTRTVTYSESLGRYQITSESPYQKPIPATPPAPALSATPKPGESAAKDAVQRQDPGYAVRITSHSADWKQFSAETGPRGGAFVNTYGFHWDEGLRDYVLDHAGLVGEAPPPNPPGE